MGGQKRKALPRRWRWVSRDNYSNSGVEIWPGEGCPERKEGSEYYSCTTGSGQSGSMCYKEFVKVVGFNIEQGTCVKVEFSAKLIKSPARVR